MRKHHWGFANPRRKKPETASEDKTKETKDDGKDKEKDTTNKDDTKTSEKTRFVGEKHESEANANELAKDIYAALAEADVNPAKLVEVTARAMALRDASGLLNNRLTYSSDENRSFERTNLENAIQAANWQFSRGNWGTLQRRRTEILRDLLNIKN